jgi:hypothetical protein
MCNVPFLTPAVVLPPTSANGAPKHAQSKPCQSQPGRRRRLCPRNCSGPIACRRPCWCGREAQRVGSSIVAMHAVVRGSSAQISCLWSLSARGPPWPFLGNKYIVRWLYGCMDCEAGLHNHTGASAASSRHTAAPSSAPASGSGGRSATHVAARACLCHSIQFGSEFARTPSHASRVRTPIAMQALLEAGPGLGAQLLQQALPALQLLPSGLRAIHGHASTPASPGTRPLAPCLGCQPGGAKPSQPSFRPPQGDLAALLFEQRQEEKVGGAREGGWRQLRIALHFRRPETHVHRPRAPSNAYTCRKSRLCRAVAPRRRRGRRRRRRPRRAAAA